MRGRLLSRTDERPREAERERRPAPRPPDELLRLQAAAGNHAVAGLVARGGPAALARAPAANLAVTSPAEEYSGILHRESKLLANAAAIVAFLRARRGTPAAGSDVTVGAAEILADAKLAKKLGFKTEADVAPTLQLLVDHGVLTAAGSGFKGVLDPKTNDLATAKLDQVTGEVNAVMADFDKRAAKKDSVDPITMTNLIDESFAAGSWQEKKDDRDAQKAHADLQAQMNEHVVLLAPDPKGKERSPITRVTVAALPAPAQNAKGADVIALPVAGRAKPLEVPADQVAGIEPIATGTSATTAKLRAKLEARIEAARKTLERAQGYRTFAVEVVDFLERLRGRNTTWAGGTYPRHDWGEFSVDVFLNVGEDKLGFFREGPTETFFDAVNDTALEKGHFGTFQWRAVYNDDRMIKTVTGKYGARRISKAPHHGPAPDKLHIHLDLRPDKLQLDPMAGFRVDARGRVDPY
jgi:hypothetical protein